MPKVTPKVNFDKHRQVAILKAANDKALSVMGVQALQDIDPYVPKDQEVLSNSGISHSDKKAKDGVFRLKWSTPYAQYLWNGDVMHGNPTNRTYGPEKISFTSALAREEWAKYAAIKYGDDWKKVYGAAFRKEIGK